MLIEEMKNCPYCAEKIKKTAILCRFCKSSLQATQSNKPSSQAIIRIAEAMKKDGLGSYSNVKQGKNTLLIPSLTIIIAISLVVVYYFLPCWALWNIYTACRVNDSVALQQLVDLDALNENISIACNDAVESYAKEISEQYLTKEPSARISLSNNVIKAGLVFLTCPGLRRLIKGDSPNDVIVDGASATPENFTIFQFLSIARCNYQSLENSTILLKDVNGSTSSFGMIRTGLFSWKLNSIKNVHLSDGVKRISSRYCSTLAGMINSNRSPVEDVIGEDVVLCSSYLLSNLLSSPHPLTEEDYCSAVLQTKIKSTKVDEGACFEFASVPFGQYYVATGPIFRDEHIKVAFIKPVNVDWKRKSCYLNDEQAIVLSIKTDLETNELGAD